MPAGDVGKLYLLVNQNPSRRIMVSAHDGLVNGAPVWLQAPNSCREYICVKSKDGIDEWAAFPDDGDKVLSITI